MVVVGILIISVSNTLTYNRAVWVSTILLIVTKIGQFPTTMKSPTQNQPNADAWCMDTLIAAWKGTVRLERVKLFGQLN